MIIVFVMDSYGLLNNGTSATAQRFASELVKLGHTVRILGVESEKYESDPNYYGLKKFLLPVFQPLVDSQGFSFCRWDDIPKITSALTNADVVHLFLPFPLENQVRLIAQEMNIAVTGAFHLQPENITYTIYLGKSRIVNNALYKFFYIYFYRHIRHIHTPSKMIADQLVKHKYKNCVFHPISNGVSDLFRPIKVSRPKELEGKYLILMIGRLSREKRQDLIIKAIAKSKYNSKIQLILCGQGPYYEKLVKLSQKYLVNPVLIRFVKQEELLNIINYSDLYIHASDAESEAIACIEAFSCGLVPIISNSPNSATNQFVVDDRCLFKHGDPSSLASRIDYFIEHNDVKEELSKKYIEHSKDYRLLAQVKKLEEVFKIAYKEHEEGKDIPKLKESKIDTWKLNRLKKILKKKFNFDIEDFAKVERKDIDINKKQ